MTFSELHRRPIYERELPMHFYDEMRYDYGSAAMIAASFEAGVGDNDTAEDIYWMLMFGA
jgi:hypothetical protein